MPKIAKVQMWGNTRAVRIPKMLAEEVGLESGTSVTLVRSGKGVLISPIQPKRRYKLSELLAACKGKKNHPEQITGRVGKEIF